MYALVKVLEDNTHKLTATSASKEIALSIMKENPIAINQRYKLYIIDEPEMTKKSAILCSEYKYKEKLSTYLHAIYVVKKDDNINRLIDKYNDFSDRICSLEGFEQIKTEVED